MAEKKHRVGLLGGTFDPIHIGHLMLAEAVRDEYELEQVLFIPAAQPPHKLGRKISPAGDRYMMTVLATCSNPTFEVSDIEMRREGPSYSVGRRHRVFLHRGHRHHPRDPYMGAYRGAAFHLPVHCGVASRLPSRRGEDPRAFGRPWRAADSSAQYAGAGDLVDGYTRARRPRGFDPVHRSP